MKRLQAKFFAALFALSLGTTGLLGWLGDLPLFPTVTTAIVAGAAVSALLARWGTHRVLAPHRELAQRLTALAAGTLETRLPRSIHNEWDALIDKSHKAIDRVDRSRNAALQSQGRLEAVFDAMSEGVLVLDVAGQIVAANPALRELLGLWGQVDGRRVREVIRQVDINQLLNDVRESDVPIVRDIELQGAAPRVIRTHGIGIPTEGPRDGLLAVFHDVTELRRLDKVRRDFVANASHELRTPLTAIQGYAETLVAAGAKSPDGPIPEGAGAQLEAIQRNARRMAQLIDDLITLSRIEGAPERSERVPVDLERLALRMVSDLRPRIERAQLSAEIIPAQSPAIAWADRQSVEQILENLITNAIRYTDAGGWLKIEIEPSSDGLEMTVADSGIGIPEEALDRIFERFYRVDASRTRAVGSTGLGLSIARHLVESQGGTLRVESEIGVGSRFTFSLPRPPSKPKKSPTA